MKVKNNFTVKFSNDITILKMPNVKFSNLYFLEIKINGVLVTVMFDTGATITVLNESIVDLIGAETTANTLNAGGSAGNIRECKTVLISKINLGSNELHEKEVLVIPDEALDFGLDEEGNKFIAQGLLGWDIISLFKWTVDRTNELFTIEKSYHKNVLHNLSWNNFPLIKIAWKDKTVCLGFDSGHTESIIGSKMIEHFDVLDSTIDTTVGVDGILEEEVYITEEFNFSIGKTPVSLNNTIILKRDIFGQGCTDMMGLLGADIIQNRKWLLDYPNEYFEIM